MNLPLLIAAALGSLTYVGALLCVLRGMEARALAMVCAALLIHGLALAMGVEADTGRIGLTLALSLLTWQTALILTALWRAKTLQPLRVSIYGISAFGLLLGAIPTQTAAAAPENWKILLHVAFSIFAAGLLTLAAAQAVAVAVISRLLHQPQRLAEALKLPSLQASEEWFFQLIAAGFFTLSLALLSGLIFVDDLLGQHLAHKTVFSVIAWAVFAALLIGKNVWNWRGKRAMRWALSGYALLLISYFGSKLVLEQVLNRHW